MKRDSGQRLGVLVLPQTCGRFLDGRCGVTGSEFMRGRHAGASLSPPGIGTRNYRSESVNFPDTRLNTGEMSAELL
jgi:hypothetical protein